MPAIFLLWNQKGTGTGSLLFAGMARSYTHKKGPVIRAFSEHDGGKFQFVLPSISSWSQTSSPHSIMENSVPRTPIRATGVLTL